MSRSSRRPVWNSPGSRQAGGGLPGGEHMSRQRQNWTDAEDDLLRHLADSDASSREIGERIGRSEYAVRSRMKFLRISRRGGLVQNHENWSEEELVALRELDGKGMLLTEISARLGRDRTSVAAKARALGLWQETRCRTRISRRGQAIPNRSARRGCSAKLKRGASGSFSRAATHLPTSRARCAAKSRISGGSRDWPRGCRGGGTAVGWCLGAASAQDNESRAPAFAPPADCGMIPWRSPMRYFSE